jgi:branched-chain amino acid transport system ATP-binding protein
MLELEDVNAYYGKSHVLKDVSMTVEENKLTALLGRNGAGKSTLIKSIIGFVTVKSGTIGYHGEDITGLKPEAIAQRGIAYIPEKRRIFPNLTVAENLELARLAVDDPPALQEILEPFPRLEERSNQVGRTLSGGEQQMLAIARAFTQDPDLLLIDEPSEGLMPKLNDRLFELVDGCRNRGITVLLSEQDVNKTLAIADSVYVLETGAIVEHGSPDYIRGSDDIKRKYLSV